MKQTQKKTLGFTAAMLLCLVIALFMTIGCEKPKIPSSGEDNNGTLKTTLQGTAWKAVGIFDGQTDTLIKELNPEDGYTMTFDTNSYFMGRSASNLLCCSFVIDYQNYTFYITNIGGTEVKERGDGQLYIEILYSVQSFSFAENEFRLYYENKNKYLQFKSWKS